MADFETQMKQWIQIDNKIKELNESIKQFREKKNTIEQNIISYTTTNNVSTIKIGEEKIKFGNTKTPEVLTFKYLEKSLKEIIKNESQVQHIIEQIKLKRSVKVVPEIKRYFAN